MSQYGVTALKKDWAILCGLCLVLEHLGTSEPAIIMLKEYLYIRVHQYYRISIEWQLLAGADCSINYL